MRGTASIEVARIVRNQRAFRAAEREAAANERAATVLASVFGFEDPPDPRPEPHEEGASR